MNRAGYVLGAVTLAASPAVALAQSAQRFSTDVSATAGFSNNPFTTTGDGTDSAVISINVLPQYQLLRERSTLTLSGGVSLQQYLSRYSRNDSYSAAADYSLRASERVTAHTRLDLSSAVLGAYNNYVPALADTAQVGATAGVGTVSGGTGTVPPALTESFPALTDIGLFGFRNRRRLAQLSGDVSAGLSARDSLTVSGYVQATRYRQLPQFGDFEAYSASLGYSRRVSDRVTAGLRGSASKYDYRENNSDSRVFSLEVTGSARLNEFWTVDGALGASFVDGGTVGSTRKTSASGSLNACRRGERSNMCLQLARAVLPTGLVGSQYTNSAALNWTEQLSERDNLSLSANYSKVGGDQQRLLSTGQPLATEYVQAVVGYDRRLRERLRFVASGNYRQLIGGNVGRSKDFGGQLGLSYHFGDVR